MRSSGLERANPPDRYRRGDVNWGDCLPGLRDRFSTGRRPAPHPRTSRDTQTHQNERGKKRAPGSDGVVQRRARPNMAPRRQPAGESGRPFRGDPDASYIIVIDHREQERIRRAIKGLEIAVPQFSLQNLFGINQQRSLIHPRSRQLERRQKTWLPRTRAIAATTPNSIFAAVMPPRSSVVDAA